MAPDNSFECYEFNQVRFLDLVLTLSGADPGAQPNDQVKYLAEYLERDLGAETLLLEAHYIDRHFMEEVSLYYSSCFVSRRNSCSRMHFFKSAIKADRLRALLERAASGQGKAVAAELAKDYLGYLVVRPLPSVPVGRTVLSPMGDKPERRFPTAVGYTAHLLGLELKISALAFQQQDVAVAACATTSRAGCRRLGCQSSRCSRRTRE